MLAILFGKLPPPLNDLHDWLQLGYCGNEIAPGNYRLASHKLLQSCCLAPYYVIHVHTVTSKAETVVLIRLRLDCQDGCMEVLL